MSKQTKSYKNDPDVFAAQPEPLVATASDSAGPSKKRTTTFMLIVAVLLLIAIGAWLMNNRSEKKTSTTPQPKTQQSQIAESETSTKITQPVETADIAISSKGFSPQTVKVKAGTSVTWTNNDTADHQITADSNANGLVGPELTPQGSYGYEFDTAGTYNYHDALNPALKGTVIVD